jgi:hypothetical protein
MGVSAATAAAAAGGTILLSLIDFSLVMNDGAVTFLGVHNGTFSIVMVDDLCFQLVSCVDDGDMILGNTLR